MTHEALKQIILTLLKDYPDKEIAAKHIIQLIKGILEEKNENI